MSVSSDPVVNPVCDLVDSRQIYEVSCKTPNCFGVNQELRNCSVGDVSPVRDVVDSLGRVGFSQAVLAELEKLIGLDRDFVLGQLSQHAGT